MTRVQVNMEDLRPKALPNGQYEADVVGADFPFTAPWDDGSTGEEPNVGVNWRFVITEQGEFKGRPISFFTTTTPGKPFASRYGETCRAINVDPEDWDTTMFDDDPMGVVLVIEQYKSKSGGFRDAVRSVHLRG